MDSLKTLMDKKQYDLVVNITKNSTDAQSLFYRISALLALGKAGSALDCIVNNQKTLTSNLKLLVKIHIEILCMLGKFDAAYAQLDYYKNLPYESQQTEETLAYYAKYIREEEKKSVKGHDLSEEEVIKRLKSPKSAIVLMGLEACRHKDVNLFIPYLEKILLDFPIQAIRSFTLLLLVEKKLNKVVKFNHVGKIIEVNPSLLEPPFQDNQFTNIVRSIQSDFKDPSLTQNALNIYSTYLIYIYPDKNKYNAKALMCALYAVASEFLQSNGTPWEDKCLQEGEKVEDVREIIEQLKSSIEAL